MNGTWERMPVNKAMVTLILVVVALIVLLAVIASSIVKIDGDEVGIVEKKLFGGALPEGKVLAVNGENGFQAQILAPGWHVKWKWQYNVTQIKMIEIKEGFVGLIQAADGRSLPADIIYAPEWEDLERMHNADYFLGEGKGYSGPQLSVLPPKKYRITKDGIEFPVAVRITYKVESENAPRIVASVGDDAMVLTKLVTPAVKSVFRNNAEKVKALDYVQNRSKQEQQSAATLKEKLAEYGVTILEVLIDDVGDEKSIGLARILKTQSDREIALQEQATFEEQQRAAEKQKALTKTQQEAEEEKRLATARYDVQIAEQDKQKRIIDAQADAERIRVTAEAKAQAYRKISEVIGASNAALIEIMKLVEAGKIRITPEVMVGGAGAGMTDALMGTVLRGMLGKEAASKKK